MVRRVKDLRQFSVCAESGEVSADSWKERDIRKEDVLLLDETGCFWRALPNSGFGQRGKECKGGETSKHRLTVSFIVSAAWIMKSRHIIIWKSKNPML